jgi:hypothetical protein
MDKGMFEGGVVGQQGVVQGTVRLCDMAFVFRQHFIQKLFLLLDLLYENDHGVVVRSDNVA